MAANHDSNSSADISFDSVGNASVDSGALADVSSAERASVSSANSVEVRISVPEYDTLHAKTPFLVRRLSGP